MNSTVKRAEPTPDTALLTSSSMMAIVAVLAPGLSPAPVGLDRVTVKVSVGSTRVSFTMGMAMVCRRQECGRG